jgi:hypothetical protein
LAVAVVVGSIIWWRCLGRFERSYLGQTETEVTSILGPPYYDSRKAGTIKAGKGYALGWYYSVGATLTIHFDSNGRVLREVRGSK